MVGGEFTTYDALKYTDFIFLIVRMAVLHFTDRLLHLKDKGAVKYDLHYFFLRHRNGMQICCTCFVG